MNMPDWLDKMLRNAGNVSEDDMFDADVHEAIYERLGEIGEETNPVIVARAAIAFYEKIVALGIPEEEMYGEVFPLDVRVRLVTRFLDEAVSEEVKARR